MADQVMLDIGAEDMRFEIGQELQLSHEERKILELYDQLEQLKLEASYFEALKTFPQDVKNTSATDNEAKFAKAQLLEAKALYTLRNNIVDSVLVANPVLQAVHAGDKASPVEKDLLPFIQTRDELSVKLTDTTSKTLVARESLVSVQTENAALESKNADMAEQMMRLAEEVNTQKTEDVKNPEIRAQLDELQMDLKSSRQKWRMMKGMVSAVIAGSGVDWARDKTLRELVLDNDDEDER